MEKEELIKHQQILERILNDFLDKEQHYIHGKSSKIRKRALTYMESYLKRFERYVTENKELYALLTADKVKEDDKVIIWEEINSIQYFSRIMPFALEKIEAVPGGE